MNWANKISPYAILVLALVGLTTLQAQVEQQPDTLRFDPETGLPVEEETEPDTTPQFDPLTGLPIIEETEPDTTLQFDPETGLPVKAKPAEPAPEEPPPEEPRPEEIADDEKDKRPPLLSQDLLVDSEGGEYSGTLIEITDTHIYFQLPGRTTPIQIPLKSVKRVTLADGSIAYEGEPEPAETEAAAAGEPPVFTEAALMTMARDNAERNHDAGTWGLGGGLLGCGGMWAGAIGGMIVVDAITYSFKGSLFGFGMGAVGGGILTAELLARFPTSVSLPAELAGATPQLREQYRQLYQIETRKLRRKSTYKGVIGAGCAAAAAAAAAMFILIISPPSF